MRNTWIGLVTLSLLLTACGQEKPASPEGAQSPPAQAKLQLAARPAAEVQLNGKVVGKTPLTLDCEPGKHEVVLKAEGFLDYRAELEVASGATAQIDRDLVVRDATDPLVLSQVAREFELELEGLDELERHRGAGDDDAVWVLYPRDNLRIDDLNKFRIDVGVEFEAEGTLEFRKGSKVLYSAAFDPEELTTVAPIPAEVVEILEKKGGTVTWGFYPKKGKAITEKFKVVKRDASLAKRLESMDKRMASQPEVVQHQLRAQLYLNKKYFVAAMNEAQLAIEKAESAPQAVAILTAAARRMKLTKTPIWSEIMTLHDAVPQKARDRFNKKSR